MSSTPHTERPPPSYLRAPSSRSRALVPVEVACIPSKRIRLATNKDGQHAALMFREQISECFDHLGSGVSRFLRVQRRTMGWRVDQINDKAAAHVPSFARRLAPTDPAEAVQLTVFSNRVRIVP